MQHQRAWEVPARLDGRHTGHDFLRLLFDVPSHMLPVGTLNPLLVFARDVHRASERGRPAQVRGVIVRVRDDDRFQPAVGVYEVDRGVVQVRDAVPEDVAGGGFEQDRSLADAEFGLRPD